MNHLIQSTISGTDFNGFVWQNVFHLSVDDLDNPTQNVLIATNDWINTNVLPPLVDAMSDQTTILDIASKYAINGSSYTLHKSVNSPGSRGIPQDTGATAGRIVWFPAEGANVGHQFISGVCSGDFLNDYITDAYIALLDDVRDGFLNLTGTDGTFAWLFTIVSKATAAAQVVIAGESMFRVGVLSKRVRA